MKTVIDAKVICMIGDLERESLKVCLGDDPVYDEMTNAELRHWVREGYTNGAIGADIIVAEWESES